MDPQPVDYLSLHGKRVLVVEEDDKLFCALTDALHDAGCETLGLPSHIPETLFALPESHVDAALLDVDLQSTMAAALADRLNERGVPILLISADRTGDLPASFRTRKRLRKPFTEQELLDGIAGAMHIEEEADSG